MLLFYGFFRFAFKLEIKLHFGVIIAPLSPCTLFELVFGYRSTVDKMYMSIIVPYFAIKLLKEDIMEVFQPVDFLDDIVVYVYWANTDW